MRKWWARRQKQRKCFHHDPGGNPANTHTAISWIAQEIIDYRKRYWCTHCRKVWII